MSVWKFITIVNSGKIHVNGFLSKLQAAPTFARRVYFRFQQQPLSDLLLNKMAEIAFGTMLTRLGFNVKAVLLNFAQGINTLSDLCTLSAKEIDEMMKHLSAWKPTSTSTMSTITAQGSTAPVTRATTWSTPSVRHPGLIVFARDSLSQCTSTVSD